MERHDRITKVVTVVRIMKDQISARTPPILTKFYCDFLQSL
jgi:hypothetical protein